MLANIPGVIHEIVMLYFISCICIMFKFVTDIHMAINSAFWNKQSPEPTMTQLFDRHVYMVGLQAISPWAVDMKIFPNFLTKKMFYAVICLHFGRVICIKTRGMMA